MYAMPLSSLRALYLVLVKIGGPGSGAALRLKGASVGGKPSRIQNLACYPLQTDGRVKQAQLI